MIRIAVIGDIGSGKSFFARQLKIPLFCADEVVQSLYNKNRSLFTQLKKVFPKNLEKFPIKKFELINIINKNPKNLKKIIKIVHPIVRKEMKLFLRKKKNNKAIVLDIPLFLENKLNLETDVLIFIDAGYIDFNVKESFVGLLEMTLVTIIGFYFGSRGIEKFKKPNNEKKKN